MIRKITSVLLLTVFGLVLLPGESLHTLFEEHHNEDHHCHSDVCVREFEPNCELGHYKISETLHVQPEKVGVILNFFILHSTFPEEVEIADQIQFPPNKAPPAC